MNIDNIATDSDNVPSPDSSTSPSTLQELDLLILTVRSHHKCCLWTGLKWSGRINIGPQLQQRSPYLQLDNSSEMLLGILYVLGVGNCQFSYAISPIE